jgi:3-methyladenine DNA glycosylase Tag
MQREIESNIAQMTEDDVQRLLNESRALRRAATAATPEEAEIWRHMATVIREDHEVLKRLAE